MTSRFLLRFLSFSETFCHFLFNFSSIHIQAAKLRISALTEEKRKLRSKQSQRSDRDSSVDIGESFNTFHVEMQLKKIQSIIDMLNQNIANLQQALDSSGDQGTMDEERDAVNIIYLA